MADPSCAERVDEHKESRISTLRDLWDLYSEEGPESYHPEHGTNMNEYGLSFDYVAPETFPDQPEGYFRYQISWGGPSDEFRIYAQRLGEYSYSIYRIEYWFLDWFDGANVVLEGEDLKLISEIFESFFVEAGSADHVLNEALEQV